MESDEGLPDRVDVVIVGAGLIGCFAALELAERGLSVAICEKGVVAGEASGRALGYIDSLFVDPIKIPLMERAKQLWEEVNARVGADTGYRRTGVTILFSDAAQAIGAEEWLSTIDGRSGMDARLVDGVEAARLAPGSSRRYPGALHQPSDAVAEPTLVAPLVADAARARGAKVLQGCAVRAIELAAGRVAAVRTERGRIACDWVVAAGGAWTPALLDQLGIALPQFVAFSGGQRRAPVEGPLPAVITANGAVVRPNAYGGVDACTPIGTVPLTPAVLSNLHRLRPAWSRMSGSLRPVVDPRTFARFWGMGRAWSPDRPGPPERARILVPETRADLDRTTGAKLADEFPHLARAPVVERWSGVMTSTLDNMPYISRIQRVPGLVVGSGFYFGFSMAPAAGEALADLVTGRPTKFDLGPYRASRFLDGSRIVFRE